LEFTLYSKKTYLPDSQKTLACAKKSHNHQLLTTLQTFSCPILHKSQRTQIYL
jgi:hypothetical protein